MIASPFQTKWLVFKRAPESHQPASGKTEKWYVYTLTDDLLGEIKWFSNWRQYCFHPKCGTVFNPTCMDDISDTCRILMKDKASG